MKKIYKSIKLIALLVACLAIPSLAGAQVVKNMYFNIDWQINSPFSQDFSDKTSGWGAHAEAGYYVIPNFSVGAFISYHTNNKYIDRQTLPVSSTSAITSDQQHSIFQLPFGAAFRYNVAPESQFQPYAGVQLGASYSEMSTYMNVILLSSSSEGYEICDRVIQWSGNDGRGHISRSKIKDMCIMPPFVMRDILKVIRASETAEAVIPLWEVIPGEYEEYAHQVLNSNAGKKGFSYRYISHRPFRSGDIYWIMEHQLQELKVDGRPCFEKVSLMTDEATIHVTCSEYFFWCCKELETIFYHYSENHVEEL